MRRFYQQGRIISLSILPLCIFVHFASKCIPYFPYLNFHSEASLSYTSSYASVSYSLYFITSSQLISTPLITTEQKYAYSLL